MSNNHIHFEEAEPGVMRCADLPSMSIRLPRWWSLWPVYRVMNNDCLVVRCLSLHEAGLAAFAFEMMLDHAGGGIHFQVSLEESHG